MQAVTTIGLDIAKSVFQVHFTLSVERPGVAPRHCPMKSK
jgi:hypothetical protein